MDLARFVVRQAAEEAEATPGKCESNNEYDGRMGLRISAIFVILLGSTLGAFSHTYSSHSPDNETPRGGVLTLP